MSLITKIPGFKNRYMIILGFFLTILMIAPLVFAHGWKSPKSDSQIENPIPVTAQALAAGQQVYGLFCADCHGMNAQGGSKTAIGIQKNPPDLKKRLASHSDGDFFWKIQQGRGDMPGFKQDLEDREIWQVIQYLRNLTIVIP